ncbi:MAG: HAMP domain-containing histidine kinase [Archangiaceae bacterium]|nr:HAMP domain-containing histidine kinase [Archangiaceae bacterium]
MELPLADIVLSMLGSAAFLAVAVLAWLRGREKNVAWPFSLLCLDLFAYNLLQAITDLTNQPAWGCLNAAAASFATPFFYHLVTAFVGKRRALGPALLAVYLYFGALAALCLQPFFIEGNQFPGSSGWAIAVLCGEVPIVAHCTWLLVRNLVGTSSAERARTRLVLASAVIGGLASISDLVSIAGASWTSRIGVWGLLLSALVLGAAALRVLEGVSVLTWVSSTAIALTVVLAEVAVFRGFGHHIALAGVATVIIGLAAGFSLRLVVADWAKDRERTLAHASLGALAAQMAHDIRNPLASIRGATQFLAGERAAGRSVDGQGEFFELLVQQCDRLTHLVDQYQRIGRAEPLLSAASVNDAAREAMKFLGPGAVDAQLAEKLPQVTADADLIVIALENVLRNAHEASAGKPLHLSTGVVTRDEKWVFVAVRDEGPGMDPRTRERVLEGFFTTKAHGSGLGLAFVRRVVEAHKGRLLIDSREGEGTTVRIELRSAA